MNSEPAMEQRQPTSVADPELLEAMVARELQESKPDGKLSGTSKAMLLGGNAADLLSTLYGLQHGALEQNPMYGGENPSAAKVMAIKGAGTLASYLLMRQLAKRHPQAANLASKILGAGLGGVAAWNVSQAK